MCESAGADCQTGIERFRMLRPRVVLEAVVLLLLLMLSSNILRW